MSKLIIVPLIIFLVSCKTKIICSQVNSANIKPIPICDLSLQFNRCRCKCFDPNKWLPTDDIYCSHNGESFKSGSYPIDYCEGIAGFFLEDIATEVKPKIKKLAKIKSDNCR